MSGTMNWRILVDTSNLGEAPTRGTCRMAMRETAHWEFQNGRNTFRVLSDSEFLAGAPYHEMQGHRPELPPGFESTPVLRVTAVGTPPVDGIQTGIYETQGASAEVRHNGDRLKMELSADSLASAWELYKKILNHDTSVLTVPYRKVA